MCGVPDLKLPKYRVPSWATEGNSSSSGELTPGPRFFARPKPAAVRSTTYRSKSLRGAPTGRIDEKKTEFPSAVTKGSTSLYPVENDALCACQWFSARRAVQIVDTRE